MPTPSPSESWIEAGHEAGLLLSAQHGDRTAFYELLRAHHRPLYALCFALARRRDEAAVLVAETARLAWRGLYQLPVGRPFFPYAARIARNLAVAHSRRREGARRASIAPSARAADWSSPGLAPLSATERRLLAAFAELPEDDQMLLALRLVEGLGYAALARVFDVPVGAVMHRLQSARTRLDSDEERVA